MQLLDLTNEIVNLVLQVATFVFPVGVAIFVFGFKNMKDVLEKHKELKIESVIMPKFERLKEKTNKLFISGVTIIFYAIFIKIVISQFISSFDLCVLWLILIGAITLLVFVFYFFYSILLEIGLTSE